MKTRLKKFLNKHKNRIFSFIAVIACVPLFSINSYAFTIPLSSVPIVSDAGVNERFVALYNGEFVSYSSVYDPGEFSTEFDITRSGDIDYMGFSFIDTGFTYSYNYDSYDYYVCLNVFFSSYDSFFTSSNALRCAYLDGNNTFRFFDCFDTRIAFSRTQGVYRGVFSAIGRIPDNIDFSSLLEVVIYGSGYLASSTYNEYTKYVYQVPKGTDVETVNSLISAINNQTTTLGGKIDDTNNFIDKGNSSTGGIVIDNNSAIDNLDDVVSEYRATEETFFNDFNTNQQAITSDIVGWSWGGLVDCADWVGETLTSYYNNMGDFRQYIIYPLMLGIALFFLGRGGSIIGHLFRKPTETTVNTKSVFRREGNTRYITTTTSRQGGVWRK